MSYLTYIFPVLAVFFCLMCARQWLPLFSGAGARLPQDPDTGLRPKPRFSFSARAAPRPGWTPCSASS